MGMDVVTIFVFSLVGAFISRFHGGGFFDSPRWLRNTLWALPFAVLAGPWAPVAFTMCFLGKTTGHGRGISLGEPLKGEPEKLEVFTLWLLPYLTDYQYKLLLLFVSGILSVSGGIFISPYVLNGGALKPLAYAIGWSTYPEHGTVIGEYLTGFFAFTTLGILVWH